MNESDYIPTIKNYNNLPPFKGMVIQQFPFIEEDFDAITNYRLLCKVVEYLKSIYNNDIIEQENITSLYNAYTKLVNYIDNYFDNLDVQEEINNKLDELVEDGTITNLIKNYVDPIYQSFETSVNNSINTMQNEIESLASGSPKGVYETLESLINNNPVTGVYIVSSNGHLYSWTKDGSNAIDLGVYQGIEIPNGSVTPIKTSFLLTGKNKYNKNTVKTGFIYYQNGAYTTNDNFRYSDYIYLKQNQSYYLYTRYDQTQIAYYNSSKEFISGELFDGDGTLTIPTGAYYVIISIPKARINDTQLEEGSSKTSYEEFYYYIDYFQDANINNRLNELEIRTDNIQKIFHIGSSQEYTTLREGISAATEYNNSLVIVDAGTYDLYNEFGGETFFENFNPLSDPLGIILKNGVHVIFSSNSKVEFHYTGDNDSVKTEFSCFNAGPGGFTLENLTLEDSGCRYSVHDERGKSTDIYKNHYINCNLKHDCLTNGGYTQAIGGGLGGNGEIIIENCVFESVGKGPRAGVVSYHNNNSSTNTSSKCNVVIKDNYFVTGTIRVSWCGVSTLITNFVITNNKLTGDILHSAERTQDVIVNTNIIEWNNIKE